MKKYKLLKVSVICTLISMMLIGCGKSKTDIVVKNDVKASNVNAINNRKLSDNGYCDDGYEHYNISGFLSNLLESLYNECGYDYDECYDDDCYDNNDYYGDDCYGDDCYDNEYYYDDEYCDDNGCYGEDYYEDGYGGGNNDYHIEPPANTNLPATNYPLGSCGNMRGTTLLVSVYLNDTHSSWTNADKKTKNDSLKFTGMAADWITASAARYGSDSRFIYDWNKNPDLYYEGNINVNMLDVDRNGEYVDDQAWKFIDTHVDSKALLKKYNANNIAYLMFVNTPKRNNITSCTRDYYEGMPYPYEMCYIYMHCDNEEIPPAGIAHEILHTFGAPDLYNVDRYGDNYGVSQRLVNELERTRSNDIMFTVYDANTDRPHYDRITNDFTEVDAYYVGIINSCDFVNKWGMQPSQHR